MSESTRIQMDEKRKRVGHILSQAREENPRASASELNRLVVGKLKDPEEFDILLRIIQESRSRMRREIEERKAKRIIFRDTSDLNYYENANFLEKDRVCLNEIQADLYWRKGDLAPTVEDIKSWKYLSPKYQLRHDHPALFSHNCEGSDSFEQWDMHLSRKDPRIKPQKKEGDGFWDMKENEKPKPGEFLPAFTIRIYRSVFPPGSSNFGLGIKADRACNGLGLKVMDIYDEPGKIGMIYFWNLKCVEEDQGGKADALASLVQVNDIIWKVNGRSATFLKEGLKEYEYVGREGGGGTLPRTCGVWPSHGSWVEVHPFFGEFKSGRNPEDYLELSVLRPRAMD